MCCFVVPHDNGINKYLNTLIRKIKGEMPSTGLAQFKPHREQEMGVAVVAGAVDLFSYRSQTARLSAIRHSHALAALIRSVRESYPAC